MGRLTNSNINTCLLNDESGHVMFCSFSRIRYSNMSHSFYKRELYRVEERTSSLEQGKINPGFIFVQINVGGYGGCSPY